MFTHFTSNAESKTTSEAAPTGIHKINFYTFEGSEAVFGSTFLNHKIKRIYEPFLVYVLPFTGVLYSFGGS